MGAVERGQRVGDRANKFIGLLSERYTGLSPGSRASRAARDGGEKEKDRTRRRLSLPREKEAELEKS